MAAGGWRLGRVKLRERERERAGEIERNEGGSGKRCGRGGVLCKKKASGVIKVVGLPFGTGRLEILKA